LQKLGLELNEESLRADLCQLPETLLITRIFSTLPEGYFEFRTQWESVPRDDRTVEYLLEHLSMEEMRNSKKTTDTDAMTSAALVAKGTSTVSK
jgi:gag-polypeptide of LTR copia-type